MAKKADEPEKSRTLRRTRKTRLEWREALRWLSKQESPIGTREMALGLGISHGHAYILLERMRLFGTASSAGARRGGRLYLATPYGVEISEATGQAEKAVAANPKKRASK